MYNSGHPGKRGTVKQRETIVGIFGSSKQAQNKSNVKKGGCACGGSNVAKGK